MGKTITYSPSATIALTRACANGCLYCGFREDGAGLLSFREIKKVVTQSRVQGVSEVLLISGEKADQVKSVQDALNSMGLDSMLQWTKHVCDYILKHDLLPHINIGVLDYQAMKELKEVSASMGLMMEGDYGGLGSRIHPEKNFAERVQHLEHAGELKIPFTTGILMGLGEAQRDRIASIEPIINCTKRYGHVQEIILQPYVRNNRSCVIPNRISVKDLKEIVAFCRENIPTVHLQLPPNLNSNWHELIDLGFDDLGGISVNGDLVNSENPWPPVNRIENTLKAKDYNLKKRLPIYPEYLRRGWASTRVCKVIERLILNNEEYRYYTQ